MHPTVTTLVSLRPGHVYDASYQKATTKNNDTLILPHDVTELFIVRLWLLKLIFTVILSHDDTRSAVVAFSYRVVS